MFEQQNRTAMGTKHSTERKSTKTPQEEKREKEDKEHKEYLNKVLARNDASAELKSTLIECAETKKSLKEAQAGTDLLQAELSTAHEQYKALASKHDLAQELQRQIVLTNGVALFAIFLLLFILHLRTNAISLSGIPPLTSSECSAADRFQGSTNQDVLPNDEDILIVSRASFATVYSQLEASQSRGEFVGPDAAQHAFNALQTYKSPVSYYQVLNIIQRELLPQITFTLVATCLGITLVFTAIVGSIVPHWNDMSTTRRFYVLLHSTAVFFALGLYLSSLHDSIDIPAGVVLTIAVLGCPFVVFAGVAMYKQDARHAVMLPNEFEWCVLLSALSVCAFSAVLLHTVAFAPLAIPAIGAVSALVWVLLDLALHRIGSAERMLFIALALWVGSLCLWSSADTLVEMLQPSRINATYSLVTNVSIWLDWGLMLTAYGWYLQAYVFSFYSNPANLEFTRTRNHPPPASIGLAAFLNFAHMAMFLYIAMHSHGARGVTVSAYAHLCGVQFALESVMLVAFTHEQPIGVAELVSALQAVLLLWSTRNNYSMLMVCSVLNVAMYILLKFGVMVAAGVAAMVIAGVVMTR